MGNYCTIYINKETLKKLNFDDIYRLYNLLSPWHLFEYKFNLWGKMFSACEIHNHLFMERLRNIKDDEIDFYLKFQDWEIIFCADSEEFDTSDYVEIYEVHDTMMGALKKIKK